MKTIYEQDVIAWANEQAALLCAGKWSDIDIENIANEIESVGKAEQREFERRVSMLLASLLGWQVQPGWRSPGKRQLISLKRQNVLRRINSTPSLENFWADAGCLDGMWEDALVQAIQETGRDFPENLPWTVEQVLSADFFPE